MVESGISLNEIQKAAEQIAAACGMHSQVLLDELGGKEIIAVKLWSNTPYLVGKKPSWEDLRSIAREIMRCTPVQRVTADFQQTFELGCKMDE